MIVESSMVVSGTLLRAGRFCQHFAQRAFCDKAHFHEDGAKQFLEFFCLSRAIAIDPWKSGPSPISLSPMRIGFFADAPVVPALPSGGGDAACSVPPVGFPLGIFMYS